MIVTDSSACIPPDRLDENIVVVPLDLIIAGKTYRDGIDISNQQFYQLLPTLSEIPHTSGAITGPYLEIFKKVHLSGDQIICFTEPARFTSIHQSALLARNLLISEFPDARIEVVESHPAAAGLGLVALYAAGLCASGENMESVVGKSLSMMYKVQLMAVLDTLRFMEKSGRIPHISSIASAIGIKPMFSLNGGAAQITGFARSMERAVNALVESMKKNTGQGMVQKIAVMHADNLNMATKLGDRISGIYPNADIYVTEFTPVMGAHTGPGLVGMAFY